MTTETTSELCDRLDALYHEATRARREYPASGASDGWKDDQQEGLRARAVYANAMLADGPELMRRLRVAKRALRAICDEWGFEPGAIAEEALREMGDPS